MGWVYFVMWVLSGTSVTVSFQFHASVFNRLSWGWADKTISMKKVLLSLALCGLFSEGFGQFRKEMYVSDVLETAQSAVQESENIIRVYYENSIMVAVGIESPEGVHEEFTLGQDFRFDGDCDAHQATMNGERWFIALCREQSGTVLYVGHSPKKERMAKFRNLKLMKK